MIKYLNERLTLSEKINITLAIVLLLIIFLSTVVFLSNIFSLEKKINKLMLNTFISQSKQEIKNSVLIEKQIIKEILKYHDFKKLLKSDVDYVSKMILTLYKTFPKNKNIKNMLLDIVKNTKNDCNTQYFFVFDTKGNILAYPTYFQYSMPNNLKKMNFPSKNILFEAIKKIKQTKSLLLYYQWMDPVTSKIELKIGYFRYIPELDWIIGKGIYVKHIRKHLIDLITKIINVRYGKNLNGYFFALDMEKDTLILHPFYPVNRSYDYNPVFRYIMKENGFVEYQFPNPTNLKTYKKISYITTIKPLNIKIGTGETIYSFEKIVKNSNKKTIKYLYELIIHFVLITIFILLTSIFMTNSLLKHLIIAPLNEIKNFTTEVLKYSDFEQRINIKTNDEFKILADELNSFLDYVQKKLDYFNKILKQL